MDNKCRFCEDFAEIVEIDNQTKKDKIFYGLVLKRAFIGYGYTFGNAYDINYCPMCGNKIEYIE